jgi:hypothetical protein
LRLCDVDIEVLRALIREGFERFDGETVHSDLD